MMLVEWRTWALNVARHLEVETSHITNYELMLALEERMGLPRSFAWESPDPPSEGTML